MRTSTIPKTIAWPLVVRSTSGLYPKRGPAAARPYGRRSRCGPVVWPPLHGCTSASRGSRVRCPHDRARAVGARGTPEVTADTGRRAHHRRAWVRIFVGGLFLWTASVVVTVVTQNSNLLPTVILLGSFLVPVTFVAYAFEHRASDTLTEHSIFVAFVYGGVLGVLGASLLESQFAGQESLLTYVGVGLVE